MSRKRKQEALPQTRDEAILVWLKNHKVGSVFVVAAVVISSIATVTDSISKIGDFFGQVLSRGASTLPPPNWEAVRGQWEGPDKKGVIRGKAQDFDALYLFKDTFRDFVFSAKVQVIDREASLALRMTPDGKNGYLVIFVPEGSIGGNPGLHLAKRVNGDHTFPGFYPARLPLKEWVGLAVRMQGSRILVYLNGKPVIDLPDNDPPIFTEGRLGFRIFGDPSTIATANFSEIHLAH